MNEIATIEKIRPLLAQCQKQITSLLEDEKKAKKFMAAALVVAQSPNLSACTPESIVQSCVGVAMADLSIDPNIGHCYIIPRSAKENGRFVKKAQMQISYKGFKQLLHRAGWMVKELPVYSCDEYSERDNGWDSEVTFIKNLDAREEGDNEWVFENLRGIRVVARNMDTKEEYGKFVNKKVIEKLRLLSDSQKLGDYTKEPDKLRLKQGLPIGVWREWYEEMAIAKAIKKLAKSLPIGDERVLMSIAADDMEEIGKRIDYKKSATTQVLEIIPEDKENKAHGGTVENIINYAGQVSVEPLGIDNFNQAEDVPYYTGEIKSEGEKQQ